MRKIVVFTFCVLFMFLLIGCRAIPTPITNTETRIEYRDRVKVETVTVHDSIIVSEEGIDRWHEVEKIVHDTIRVNVTDTIRVPVFVEKEVEVERELTWFETVKMKVGGWLILFVIIMLISYFVKKYFKL